MPLCGGCSCACPEMRDAFERAYNEEVTKNRKNDSNLSRQQRIKNRCNAAENAMKSVWLDSKLESSKGGKPCPKEQILADIRNQFEQRESKKAMKKKRRLRNKQQRKKQARSDPKQRPISEFPNGVMIAKPFSPGNTSDVESISSSERLVDVSIDIVEVWPEVAEPALVLHDENDDNVSQNEFIFVNAIKPLYEGSYSVSSIPPADKDIRIGAIQCHVDQEFPELPEPSVTSTLKPAPAKPTLERIRRRLAGDEQCLLLMFLIPVLLLVFFVLRRFTNVSESDNKSVNNDNIPMYENGEQTD